VLSSAQQSYEAEQEQEFLSVITATGSGLPARHVNKLIKEATTQDYLRDLVLVTEILMPEWCVVFPSAQQSFTSIHTRVHTHKYTHTSTHARVYSHEYTQTSTNTRVYTHESSHTSMHTCNVDCAPSTNHAGAFREAEQEQEFLSVITATRSVSARHVKILIKETTTKGY